MSSDWYARQFGDRDEFAVAISLGRDPLAIGNPAIDAGWGGLAVWTRGRCLTRNVSGEGAAVDQVRWNLRGVFTWLAEVGPRLQVGDVGQVRGAGEDQLEVDATLRRQARRPQPGVQADPARRDRSAPARQIEADRRPVPACGPYHVSVDSGEAGAHHRATVSLGGTTEPEGVDIEQLDPTLDGQRDPGAVR